MQQFQNLKIIILEYVDYLLSLALNCQDWPVLKGLILIYGNTHALFCKIAAAFGQRLLMHFGLIEFKLKYNVVDQLDDRIRSLQQKFKSFIISNITLDEGVNLEFFHFSSADCHVINNFSGVKNLEDILTVLFPSKPKSIQLDLYNDDFHIHQLSKKGYKNDFNSLSLRYH
jgi:hypothetical protein